MAGSPPFVTMQAGNITAQIDPVLRTLDGVKAKVVNAASRALDLLGEDMLAQAQANVNTQTGRTQESATSEPVVLEGSTLVKRWGFNIRHGLQLDKGGPIFPVNGHMLAIPLSEAAKKLASPLEQNDLDLVPLNGRLFLVERPAGGGQFQAKDLQLFHWMLVPKVDQKGTQFVSKVVQARRADVPRVVAEEVGKAIGGGK
jgi:hypothetical protein